MEPGPESIKSLQTSGKMHTGEILADNVRVAFFSDSLPERNGTGAYYHDLAGQLSPHLESLHIFQPIPRAKHSLFSLPTPGDPMQRLVTPNLFRIRKGFKELNPNIIVSITPGPFGLLGLTLAKLSKKPFISAFSHRF